MCSYSVTDAGLTYCLKRNAPHLERTWKHLIYTQVFSRLLIRPEIDPETKDYLLDIYRTDMHIFEGMTARNLSHLGN